MGFEGWAWVFLEWRKLENKKDGREEEGIDKKTMENQTKKPNSYHDSNLDLHYDINWCCKGEEE